MWLLLMVMILMLTTTDSVPVIFVRCHSPRVGAEVSRRRRGRGGGGFRVETAFEKGTSLLLPPLSALGPMLQHQQTTKAEAGGSVITLLLCFGCTLPPGMSVQPGLLGDRLSTALAQG
jgi:hypothetical protein